MCLFLSPSLVNRPTDRPLSLSPFLFLHYFYSSSSVSTLCNISMSTFVNDYLTYTLFTLSLFSSYCGHNFTGVRPFGVSRVQICTMCQVRCLSLVDVPAIGLGILSIRLTGSNLVHGVVKDIEDMTSPPTQIVIRNRRRS